MSGVYGYVYSADLYCVSCLLPAMVGRGDASPAVLWPEVHPESWLDDLAAADAIDRDDERSFDSGDFPKVVTALEQFEPGDTCGRCGCELRPGPDDETYNGWANRETWATALHLSNDEGLYDAAREVVANGAARGSYAGGDALETWTRGLFDDECCDTATLLRLALDIGSLWRVDWHEVAASLVAE